MPMRVHTRTVWDIETMTVVESVFHYETGPCELAKGGNSQAEMNQANQLSQQELNLMQQQLSMANPTLQSIISNGGMLPSQQAALTSQVLNGIPQQYQNIEGQINNQLVARGVTGGNMAGGGAIAQGYGALGQAEAQAQQQGLTNIQTQKASQLQSALSDALGLTSTFNTGATTAQGQAVTAAGNADQASTGFWGSLFGALGTAAGGIGGGIAQSCWVARAVYGELDWKPRLIAYVWSTKWSVESRLSRFALGLYLIFGEAVGWIVKRSRILRRFLRPIFDRAVWAAVRDVNG